MKKYIFIVCVLAALCGGCTDTLSEDSASAPVRVRLEVKAETPDVPTRATDENAVRDVNLFLFSSGGLLAHSAYSEGGDLHFEALPGEYRLFVVANLHRKLDDMTLSQLQGLSVEAVRSYEDLPMSVERAVTVPDGGSVTVEVTVRRAVAKVAYTVSVAAQASGIELSSVAVYNVPRRVALFDDRPTETTQDYALGEYRSLPDGSTSCAGVLYIPQNCQGTVPGITSQQQKNRDNAPQNATYLLIRAVNGPRTLDYTVYLGENNTDNFDVRRNSFHTLDIIIRGDREVDTRVHSYALQVADDIESVSAGGYCLVDSVRRLYVDIKGNRRGIRLMGELEVTQGAGERFSFNRRGMGDYHEFDLPARGRNNFPMAYLPSVVTEAASMLRYSVTIRDELGGSRTFDFEHRYANEVRIVLHAGDAQKQKGTVAVAGALFTQETDDGLRALCYEGGCSLRAQPFEGCKFQGWYGDAG